MEPAAFVNEETKAVWEGFRFSLCDPKNATPEGCETETTDEQVRFHKCLLLMILFQIGTEHVCKTALQLYSIHMKTTEPKLEREKHIQYILKVLNRLPHESYVSLLPPRGKKNTLY